MTVSAPTTAPVLSTPDDHIFSAPAAHPPPDAKDHSGLPDDEFRRMYEIDRTVREILENGYRRVALQFPDELLGDSERVYALVYEGINGGERSGTGQSRPPPPAAANGPDAGASCCGGDACGGGECGNGATTTTTAATAPKADDANTERKTFILADTSYSACCVDEIAAEHVAADVLVHYGRSCLSPTTRLPVIYVFTSNPLDLSAAVSGFKSTFPDPASKVLLMADVTYHSHVAPLHAALVTEGYTSVFATELLHSPSALLPNRTLPPSCDEEELKTWSLFHLSPPLPSLLLVLASRVSSIHSFAPLSRTVESVGASALLRRRYALLSHARTAGIVGILVNTLNVRHYLPLIAHLKRQLRAAGRKSYLVVVGKVNVEKVANFAEVEVWVGVGCWEQGVVGGVEGRGWFRPVVTPWEIAIALGEREWEGTWVTEFAEVLRLDEARRKEQEEERALDETPGNGDGEEEEDGEEVSDDEDAPPEFDLRTGRYISTSRPLGSRPRKAATKKLPNSSSGDAPTSSALTLTDKQKELARTGGVISPAATYLKEKRTWQGLGSDFPADGEDGDEQGALVEEGRSGVARGYTVGDGEKH